MGKLTPAIVKAAGPGRHADGDGLYLMVKPGGARSWVLRVQYAGQRRDIGLGGVDVSTKLERLKADTAKGLIGDDLTVMERALLTLGEAREKALLLRRVAKAGRDPVAERDKDRAASPIFSVAVTKAHKALEGNWGKREADAFLASLKQHANPSLGKRRVDHIDANDIAAALKPIWTDKPEVARKVRQRIVKVLNYAKVKKWRLSEAPSKELSLLLGKQRKGGNMPSMPYADVPVYFQELSDAAETMGRLALMFVITTAARSGEVRQACWGQIDLDRKLWNRPATIMKSRESHTVTLNEQALVILGRAKHHRRSDEEDALVFPSPSGKAMSDMTVSKVMRDAKLPYVPHGFRSTFRDWAAEQMSHIPDAVAEAALAHTVPDKVVAAYKRTNFLEMRRALLDSWAAFLIERAVL
ncbi:tyrosine-type recombinase/integrase [Sphingobium sp. CR2-8]|uniref:tyrosine-type recombinase/integrase n=1 Tax=Sphingobium sp. CR2-8 TaxID=1306534 RepID=UPI002DB925F1|nr:tyrosine-type recombinase/integrase [Sphingobium sp. CR2-8]MEC3910279.1 tyrosine-type recombinase/integrase [Sphingobium sp. CR2-8]